MSNTPRTDAHNWHDGDYDDPLHAFADFAKQLERELNAANVEIEEKHKDVVWLATEKAKLENYVKRLEEAGDAIVGYNIGCGCGEDGPCRACCEACEEWTRAKEAKP